MTTKKRRTVLTVEIEQEFVVRRARGFRSWCPACAATVGMAAPDEAAEWFLMEARAINQLVEAGRVHTAVSAEGSLLVCLVSLLECAAGGRKEE